jgi:hypothetical protein
MMLSFAAKYDLDVELIDIKTAFLHAAQSHQIYIQLPPGWRDRPEFADSSGRPKVALLLKSLYGACDAPAAFYNILRNYLRSQGFRSNPCDPCLHSVQRDGKQLFVLHWVDDLLVIAPKATTNSPALIQQFKQHIKQEFQVSEKGPLEQCGLYLGVTIQRFREPRSGDGYKGFILSQPHLVDHLVKRAEGYLDPDFNTGGIPMLDLRLTAAMSPTTADEHARMAKLPYKTLVGSLGYLAMWTFPQISYATKELARFSANPGELHWKSLLRTVTYVKENRNWCIYLSASADINLYGYCDANYCGQPDSFLSTTGYVVFQGTSPISNCSRTQKVVSRSTAESEYIALSSMVQEMLHLRMLWHTLHDGGNLGTMSMFMAKSKQAVTDMQMYAKSDSTSAIAFAHNEWTAGKLRHVALAWHFCRSFIRDKVVHLTHAPGTEICADVHTKGFGRVEGFNPLRTTKQQKAPHFKELAMQLSGYVKPSKHPQIRSNH